MNRSGRNVTSLFEVWITFCAVISEYSPPSPPPPPSWNEGRSCCLFPFFDLPLARPRCYLDELEHTWGWDFKATCFGESVVPLFISLPTSKLTFRPRLISLHQMAVETKFSARWLLFSAGYYTEGKISTNCSTFHFLFPEFDLVACTSVRFLPSLCGFLSLLERTELCKEIGAECFEEQSQTLWELKKIYQANGGTPILSLEMFEVRHLHSIRANSVNPLQIRFEH